jgi:hypothetical protein
MGIYGVRTLELEQLEHPFENLADSPEEWRAIFEATLQSISRFLASHDPFEILAKASSQLLANSFAKKEQIAVGNIVGAVKEILTEQAEVEILQALVLRQLSAAKLVPAAPSNLERFFSSLTKAPMAFVRMQAEQHPDDPEREHVLRSARLRTIYGRNSFLKSDCEIAVRGILERIDHVSFADTGFRFSEMFLALTAIAKKIESRLDEFFGHWRAAFRATSEKEVLVQIHFYCEISPAANRAWSMCKSRCTTLDAMKFAAYQLSELCNSWIYTLDKQELRNELGDIAISFIEKIAIRPGELANSNPEHYFMNNPIWYRPFIALGEDKVFLALPSLFYGFPFQIFEQFISPDSPLGIAYSDARSTFLEDTIFDYVASGMPTARTYRKVMWRDDTSGTLYENDVVSVLGNTIFLFEAKSGRLRDAARRGGELSLLRNFKELFVEPGEQAARLENYINLSRADARLWAKDTNEAINLNLETPKVVHKFSICIEHFGSLTSAKHNLKVLGAINEDSSWAPVLSLGELMLVWRYLDTEVSFFHYLTRRATLEELVDFEGDEQDILSMYLINGLCINPEDAKGRRVTFLEMDGIVRAEKVPRKNRRQFEIYGVPLSGYWKAVLEEIYLSATLRHRFDIIQVVLNQDPHTLAGFEDVAKKWRRGGPSDKKDGDILYSRFKIGKRVFVLAHYLIKRPIQESEWTERSRQIARAGAELFEASDCAIFLQIKRSKEWTFDALSFHRLMAVPSAES